MNVIAVGEKDRAELEFNELGRPIGNASVRLSTVVGIFAREYIPITYKSWYKVDIDINDRIWEFFTVNICIFYLLLYIIGCCVLC